MTALVQQSDAAIIERVVIAGDLKSLKPEERVQYYRAVCDSVGLNPLTKPFEYIELNGKLTLYALKTTTDQLRQIHQISVTIASRELLNGVYVVTAQAMTPDGRRDESIGAVPLEREDGEWKQSSNGKRYFAKNGKTVPMTGEDLANAYMKAETKAKRRVTLSICGLGWLDESEVGSVPSARPVQVDKETGEIDQTATVQQERSAPLTPAADDAEAERRRHLEKWATKIGTNAVKIRERYPAAAPKVEEITARHKWRDDMSAARACNDELVGLANELHAAAQVVDAEFTEVPDFDPHARQQPPTIGDEAAAKIHKALGVQLKGTEWQGKNHEYASHVLGREVTSLATLTEAESDELKRAVVQLSAAQQQPATPPAGAPEPGDMPF